MRGARALGPWGAASNSGEQSFSHRADVGRWHRQTCALYVGGEIDRCTFTGAVWSFTIVGRTVR
jgi:hypothetical protein